MEINEYEVYEYGGKEYGVSGAYHSVGKIGSALIRLLLKAVLRDRMIGRADTLWIVSDKKYWRDNDPAEAYIREKRASLISEEKSL